MCNVAIHCSILFGVSAYCPGPFSMLSWDLTAYCPGPFSMLSWTFQHAVLDLSACCLGLFSMLSWALQHALCNTVAYNTSAPLWPVHRNFTVGRTPTTRLGHFILWDGAYGQHSGYIGSATPGKGTGTPSFWRGRGCSLSLANIMATLGQCAWGLGGGGVQGDIPGTLCFGGRWW